MSHNDAVCDLMDENGNQAAEIERLNEQVARLREVVTKYAKCPHEDDFFHYECPVCAACKETESDWIAKHDQEVRDNVIAVADAERLRIANLYQRKIDDDTSDMTSNSDWVRLKGAVSVVQAIRAMKGKP